MTDLSVILEKARIAAAAIPAEQWERIEAQQAKERAEVERKAEAGRFAAVPVHARAAERILAGTLEPTRARRAVDDWFAERSSPASRPLLLLLAPVGTGKTVAAAYAAHKACKVATYMRARDAVRCYRSEWGPEAEQWRSTLEVPWLVVDELGTEKDLELAAAAMTELVDERGHRARPTMLLGNLTPKQLTERYGERFTSRLRELARVVAWNATDMRRGGK